MLLARIHPLWKSDIISYILQPARLPTSRKIPNSEPLIVLPINVIINYLFQACRLLSIVPAVFGTLYNILHAVYRPEPHHMQNTSIDYVVCALWVSCYFLSDWNQSLRRL